MQNTFNVLQSMMNVVPVNIEFDHAMRMRTKLLKESEHLYWISVLINSPLYHAGLVLHCLSWRYKMSRSTMPFRGLQFIEKKSIFLCSI